MAKLLTVPPRAPLPAMADTLQSSPPVAGQKTGIGPMQITVAALIVLVSLLPMPFPLLALAPIIVLALTPVAGWLSLAFLCIVAALSGVLDYMPVQAGPVNIYAIDFIAALFVWTAFYAVVHHNRTGAVPALENRAERRLVTLFVIWCALGLLFLAYGLVVKGYASDRAFGDFRRQVWYAAAFFVPLFFPYAKRHLAALKYVIVVAGIVTIAIGVYRIGAGSPARVDENFATGHLGARWVWIVECMTLSTLLAYLVLVIRAGKGALRKAIAVGLCVAAGGLLLVSGWRLAMAYTVAAPGAALLLWTWARREPVKNVVLGSIAAAVAALPALLLVPIMLPELFARTMLDLRLRLINDAVQGGFRSWATAAALSEFASSPIIGKGFGFYLTVATRNQAGFFNYVEMNNAHNIFLTALYQTGLLGFIPFTLFHALFLIYALRRLRSIPAERLPVYVALLVGYVCYMGYANTQPFVSSQFIIMYFIMGFVVLLARPEAPATPQPDPA